MIVTKRIVKPALNSVGRQYIWGDMGSVAPPSGRIWQKSCNLCRNTGKNNLCTQVQSKPGHIGHLKRRTLGGDTGHITCGQADIPVFVIAIMTVVVNLIC